jgi:hypothetical protein
LDAGGARRSWHSSVIARLFNRNAKRRPEHYVVEWFRLPVRLRLVEEFILPFVLDHARPQLQGDDYRVRAFLAFAAEEAKHNKIFPRPAIRPSFFA